MACRLRLVMNLERANESTVQFDDAADAQLIVFGIMVDVDEKDRYAEINDRKADFFRPSDKDINPHEKSKVKREVNVVFVVNRYERVVVFVGKLLASPMDFALIAQKSIAVETVWYFLKQGLIDWNVKRACATFKRPTTDFIDPYGQVDRL